MCSEEEDEQDWSDWGDDVDEDLTKSLFSSTTLSSAKQAIEHDASEHGFDLRKFRAQVGQRNAGVSESGVIWPELHKLNLIWLNKMVCRNYSRIMTQYAASTSSEARSLLAIPHFRLCCATTPLRSDPGRRMSTCTLCCLTILCCFMISTKMCAHSRTGKKQCSLQYYAKSAYNILQVDSVAVMLLSSCSDAGPSAKEAPTCSTFTAMQSLQDENMALRNTLQEMSRLALPSELATEQPFQVKVNLPKSSAMLVSTTACQKCCKHATRCYYGMQLAEGIDSDWLSKWQKSAGSFGVQAERNKLATTQADVSRGTDDATERINEAYFDSYGFFGIHREMISDKASSYMLLILNACLVLHRLNKRNG